MIHTLTLMPGMSVDELRRQGRKFLMTGGVVLRLPSGLTAADQLELLEAFSAAAEHQGGLALEALCQLAGYPALDGSVRDRLRSAGGLATGRINRALRRRPECEPTDQEAHG